MPPDTIIELPKISMEFHVEPKGKDRIVYTYEGDMPQEFQDQFQQIVGNGLAKISLGIPMDRKLFGNGAGAHVSISLTCNQDQNTINAAYALAAQAVIHYVKQNLGAALNEFNTLVNQLPPPQG